MDRREALITLNLGIKIKHRHFSPDEYIQKVDGIIRSEEGYNFDDWWENEGANLGDEGWSIWSEK